MTAGNQTFLETTTQTVSWFRGRLRDRELQLKPLFQRNPVWSGPQKSYLIDSILRGYPVPEVYIQTTEDAEGGEQHVVVDGQQRIRSCLEFIDNKFPLSEPNANWDGSFFEDLTSAEKKRIRQYKFAVRVLPELEESLLREIFGRLNRNNMALNKQELRNATYWGAFIGTMQELASMSFWIDRRIFTANDFRRMLDVEYVSELAIAALYGPQNKKDNLDRYYEDFEEDFPARGEVLSIFEQVCTALSQVVDWETASRWTKKSDFYTLFTHYAGRIDRLPLDREARAADAEKLKDFSEKVNAFIVQDTESEEAVREYGRAVQRAASDLQSRRIRGAALMAFLDGTDFVRPASARTAVAGSGSESLELTIDPDQESESVDDEQDE